MRHIRLAAVSKNNFHLTVVTLNSSLIHLHYLLPKQAAHLLEEKYQSSVLNFQSPNFSRLYQIYHM